MTVSPTAKVVHRLSLIADAVLAGSKHCTGHKVQHSPHNKHGPPCQQNGPDHLVFWLQCRSST